LDETRNDGYDRRDRPFPPRGGPRRGRDEDNGDDDREDSRGGRRFPARRRVCQFCVDKADHIDYKQSDMLRRFLTDRGKIKARRKTGMCAKHQRWLAIAIKRARHLALLPFTTSQAR